MELKSMKVSQEEAQEESQEAQDASPDHPEYPYGLQLRLEEDQLSELGIDKLPEVGSTMIITARVRVDGCYASKSLQGEDERCVTLQITDMAVGSDKKESDPTSSLYNGS